MDILEIKKENCSNIERIFFWNDGSMTNSLSLLTQSTIKVDLLEESVFEINQPEKLLPVEEIQIDKPFILRRTILKNNQGDKLIYARSIWNDKKYKNFMENNTKGAIGTLMKNNYFEHFRKIIGVFKIDKSYLKKENIEENLYKKEIARNYVFYNNSEILCYIEEFFLKGLDNYLI